MFGELNTRDNILIRIYFNSLSCISYIHCVKFYEINTRVMHRYNNNLFWLNNGKFILHEILTHYSHLTNMKKPIYVEWAQPDKCLY